MKSLGVSSVTLLLAACGADESGIVRGDRLFIQTCSNGEDRVFEPYERELEFFSLEVLEGGVASIRLQTSAKPIGMTDGLILQLAGGKAAVDARKKDPTHAFAIDGDAVRATLFNFSSCPDTQQATEALAGKVVFDDLGLERGDRVSGRAEFTLYDVRQCCAPQTAPPVCVPDPKLCDPVGDNFVAEFSFEVRAGRPYEMFPE